jgi:hypothetical protein
VGLSKCPNCSPGTSGLATIVLSLRDKKCCPSGTRTIRPSTRPIQDKSETLGNFEIKKALNRIVVENVPTEEERIYRERRTGVKDGANPGH